MIERRSAAVCDICGTVAIARLNRDRTEYIVPEGWAQGTKTNRDICFCPQCAGKLDLIHEEKDGDKR